MDRRTRRFLDLELIKGSVKDQSKGKVIIWACSNFHLMARRILDWFVSKLVVNFGLPSALPSRKLLLQGKSEFELQHGEIQ